MRNIETLRAAGFLPLARRAPARHAPDMPPRYSASIRFPAPLRAAVERRAAQLGLTQSETVRAAVEEALRRAGLWPPGAAADGAASERPVPDGANT